MDQFDREDTSTYVNRQQPSSPASSPPQPLQKASKPRRSKAPLVLTFLLLISLAVAGTLGWLWYQENTRATAASKDLAVAQEEIKGLKAAAGKVAATTDKSETTVDATSSESADAIKAALAYMQAPVNPVGSNSREAKVDYLKGDFAKVIVKTSDLSPGGTSVAVMSFSLTLKKSNDNWIVLSEAEGPVANMDELMKKYGIPREAF